MDNCPDYQKIIKLANTSPTIPVSFSIDHVGDPKIHVKHIKILAPEETKEFEKEFDGGSYFLTVFFDKGHVDYAVPVIQSAIEIDPEEGKIYSKGKIIPSLDSSFVTKKSEGSWKTYLLMLLIVLAIFLILRFKR